MSSKKNNSENKTEKKTERRDSVKDTFRKIISAGSAGEMSKELLSSALGQVHKTKEDISSKVTQEVVSLIKKIDFVKEFSKFAEEHKFKISAEIEILKKNDK